MVSREFLPNVPPPTEALRYVVKQPNSAPPGGWRYREPSTGFRWAGEASLDLLAQEVTAHRMNNAIERCDARGDVMHFTGSCLVDSGHAALVEAHRPVGRTLLQWWKGLRGYRVIARFQEQGRPLFVSPAEARRRAQVCIDCPQNVVDTDAGIAQQLSDEKLRGMAGGRETGLDDQLHTCAVCSCQTATILHLTGELLKASGQLKQHYLAKYPRNCWKHTA